MTKALNIALAFCFSASSISISFAQQPSTGNLYDRLTKSIDESVNQQQSQSFNPVSTNQNPAQDIINQQNKQAMQMMGYTPPPTADQMKVNTVDNSAAKRQKEMQELYAEINSISNDVRPVDPKISAARAKEQRKFRLADTNSVDYKTNVKYCYIAYNEITKMLAGETPLSIKRAVFITENAFYKNKLSYEKYCTQINELVFMCKQVMNQEGLNPKNQMACHYVIQKLFADTLVFTNAAGKKVVFKPFSYDFIDIFGDNDRTKDFVTKLLNTKIGQCHSMPLLYLILAEELGTKAYLAFSPNHSYIMFGNQQQAFNFETTIGQLNRDQWIVSSGYITPTAVKNRIYMTPLTSKEVIAECLMDVEHTYDFLFGKSDFSAKCANTALQYHQSNIIAIITINNLLVAKCANTAKKYKNPKEEDYDKYPELKQQFDAMLDYEMKVEATGYSKIPPEQYERWQQSASEEKQKREHQELLSKLQKSANEK